MYMVIMMKGITLKTGDLVVYSTRGICRVTQITSKTFDRERRDYFVLTPVFDEKSTYFIPVDYDPERVHIKPALTKTEAQQLIAFAETAAPLEWISSPNLRKQTYEHIYKAMPREEKIRLIKTLKAHEQHQKEIGKQLYASDARILSGCETLIGNELAYILGKTPDEILTTFV